MKKMPAHLPPLPYAAVYLGRGGEFSVPESGAFVGWRASDAVPIWDVSRTRGLSPNVHYAALTDKSEIARLNGCGKPSWDEAPEWAEWLAQDETGEWFWYKTRPLMMGRVWQPDGPHVKYASWSNSRNPNWRDTLERRPGDGLMSIREFMVQSHPDYSETPDLIIPKDVALYADAQSILNTARANDYRIEWDSNGIRGWKEP